ncbi:MAG: tyrosine-type recombinase/integrase [Chitinivibrionales bacterium]|nr:tyrosine-type recombinase/integrase [Chitinivibrionales bacterium]
MNNAATISEFKEYLKKHNYKQNTIVNYINCVSQLASLYSNKPLRSIKIREIKQFIKFLEERKKLAYGSINTAIHAIEKYFNDFLNSDFDFSDVKTSLQPKAFEPEILTPVEVLKAINAIENEKHKLIIMLIYSSGLSLSEVISLQVKDIDLKGKFIRIHNGRGSYTIRSIVSDYAISHLKSYLRKHKANLFLFQGYRYKEALSQRSIQKIFSRAVENAGINKRVSIKDLRHAFVVHLRDFGYPLISILDNLGFGNASTLYKYSKVGLEKPKVIVSPLDIISRSHFSEKVDTTSLIEIFGHLADDSDREYSQEVIKCLNAGAFRSAIIMLWILTINVINKKCLNKKAEFNIAIKKHVHNARTVNDLEDFDYFKESKVLLAAEELNIFDKSERQVLEHCLDIRNRCSHPAIYKPSPAKVLSFIDDIVRTVFK